MHQQAKAILESEFPFHIFKRLSNCGETSRESLSTHGEWNWITHKWRFLTSRIPKIDFCIRVQFLSNGFYGRCHDFVNKFLEVFTWKHCNSRYNKFHLQALHLNPWAAYRILSRQSLLLRRTKHRSMLSRVFCIFTFSEFFLKLHSSPFIQMQAVVVWTLHRPWKHSAPLTQNLLSHLSHAHSQPPRSFPKTQSEW